MKAHLLKAAVFSICLAIAGTGAVPSAGGEPCDGTYGSGPNRFVLATGSPGELGLVKALADVFTARTSTTLCWKKAGSGESLKMLKEKTVDVIMGHSPDAEKKAVAEGWAANHALIGSNEFFIVGPATDPAGIAGTSSAVEAYRKIAETRAKFFSRGDNSGTHKKELQIWAKAGVTPSGDWYVATKQFMIATLRMADSERGYFMTDSSTWVAEKKNLKNLKVLLKGDKVLVNVYHGLCQPPGSTPGAEWAAKFIAFVASDEGQNIIRGFGKDLHGEGLYNDAAYAKQFE